MGDRNKTTSKTYLAGLDGLRAIAVVAVVFYHLFPSLIPGGFIGVDIFFVISGFLITSLLITEHTRTGRINLKRFWVRRARRILPALFVTISITCSVALFVGGDILVGLGRQVLGAATFSNNWVEIAAGTNYFDISSLHLFTNFWSLAVEEQFYAVWPFILVAILGITTLTRRYRTGLWLSILLSLVSAGLMFALFSENSVTRVYYGSDTHAFGLMIGAALAFLGNARFAKALQRQDAWPSARYKHPKIIQTLGILSLGGIIALVLYLPELASVTYRGGLLLVSILTALVILAAVSNKGLLQRLLEIKWLKWIGVRSYGIYLWHWPVAVLCHYAIPIQNQWIAPLIVIGVSLFAAAASYRFLEQPIRLMGAWAFVRRGIRRETDSLGSAISSWKLRPHPIMIMSLAVVAMTVVAIMTAPQKTQAQQRIEAGAAVIAHAKKQSQSPPKAAPVSKAPVESQKPAKVITGSDISLVGDSVALASAPELQAKFPGIYINAVVSRSMRDGGLSTIEQLIAAGQLRRILVVALGTNGYFGTGTIQQLLNEVGKDRDVVFVTAHAPVEWVAGNNEYIRLIAKQYHNVYIAEWDATISAHPDMLGPDGIHPGPTGGGLYAGSIASAIAKIK
jgi:peptidoglycan/LPS O-acetylase OafA/YrhL